MRIAVPLKTSIDTSRSFGIVILQNHNEQLTPALHKLEGMPLALLWYFVIASTVAKSCNGRVWAHKRVVLT